MYDSYKKNGNRLPYGHVEVLLKELRPNEPWMTRNIVNKAFMKYRKDLAMEKDKKESDNGGTNNTGNQSCYGEIPENITLSCGSGSGTADSDLTGEYSLGSERRKGGRPQGSTDNQRIRRERVIIAAKNECTKRFADLKQQAEKKTGETFE